MRVEKEVLPASLFFLDHRRERERKEPHGLAQFQICALTVNTSIVVAVKQ